MANQSRSGLANFSRLSISKESIHEDRFLRYKVHKKNQGQPSQTNNWKSTSHLQEERSATNIVGPSHSNRDREMDMLREQVLILQ